MFSLLGFSYFYVQNLASPSSAIKAFISPSFMPVTTIYILKSNLNPSKRSGFAMYL